MPSWVYSGTAGLRQHKPAVHTKGKPQAVRDGPTLPRLAIPAGTSPGPDSSRRIEADDVIKHRRGVAEDRGDYAASMPGEGKIKHNSLDRSLAMIPWDTTYWTAPWSETEEMTHEE